MKHYFTLMALLVAGASAHAQYETELQSPDGNIKARIALSDKIRYAVSYKGKEVMTDCQMSLTLGSEVLGIKPGLPREERYPINETLKPVVPVKYAKLHNHCNALTLHFKQGYKVELRAYNDGIAYRFVIDRKGSVEVSSEQVHIGLAAQSIAHLQPAPSFKTSYEELYVHKKVSDIAPDAMATLPILIETPDGCKVLMSESDVVDYPHAFVRGSGGNSLEAVFPPVPLTFGDDGDRSVKILTTAPYIAKTKGARALPWRWFGITDSDAALAQATMTQRLAQPCVLKQTAWIQPGQVSWEWWNDASPYGEDVEFESGFNLETYKYFIDFASTYKVPYIIMDEGWAASTLDPYTPNPKVDLHALIKYGMERNVGIILWLTWLTVENNFNLFRTFEEWGIKGIKIDFMDRSDQWMVNFYQRVAQAAAEAHLIVDFHGAFKPAGLESMYPNILSYEGVRGMEAMGGARPDNSLWLPFIRNAAGIMDYTPGAMLSMQPEVYCGHRPNSASIGTRAYQMALYVVFESGLQMLSDNPTNYYRNPDCARFVANVPVLWDETRVLAAKAGEYIVTAKRRGKEWWLGAITNNTERWRTIEVSLDFLDSNTEYALTYFADGINAPRQAMDYRRREAVVNSASRLALTMSRNGGWAGTLTAGDAAK